MKKLVYLALALALVACNKNFPDQNGVDVPELRGRKVVSLSSVASILSKLDIGEEQMNEVYNAVKISTENGYDEEYPMLHVFEKTGHGVGSSVSRSADKEYSRPLSKMIEEHLRTEATRSSGVPLDVDFFLRILKSSNIQIYWPYHENWDGHSLPIITFDPGKNITTNKGYMLATNADGSKYVKEVVVSEEMAKKRPVWVINNNSDMHHTSVEMLRRQDPDWGTNAGGTIIAKNPRREASIAASIFHNEHKRRVGDNDAVVKEIKDEKLHDPAYCKTLLIKDIEIKRNYDSWFAGASEFFFKCGSIENFTAATDAELKIYNPTITDFMLVVRRSQVNKKIPFNALLVSEWREDLKSVAFMVIEDDGGKQTEWKCSAMVKYNSRSYGFDISLPLNSYDDIVWRGNLTKRYIDQNNNVTANFGDMMITFEVK